MFPNPMGHYWGSAANPYTDVCTFAVAASNGSIMVSENESVWTYRQIPSIHGRGEAVTVDWLGPDIILEGFRAGAVRLWKNPGPNPLQTKTHLRKHPTGTIRHQKGLAILQKLQHRTVPGLARRSRMVSSRIMTERRHSWRTHGG